MNTKEVIVFCFKTVFAGIAIGIGCCASLLANNLLPGLIGKLVGAMLFPFGIFAVLVFEMKLFTGMVAGIPTMGVKNLWQLAVCFIGNAVGMAFMFLLAKYSFISETLLSQGASVVAGKLASELWGVKAFCSGIACGMLITFSVQSVSAAPKKGLSSTFGVVIPIVVFVLCGFDHSVANMFYIYCFGEFSLRVIGYIVVVILGNIVGGVLFPCYSLLKAKLEEKKEE